MQRVRVALPAADRAAISARRSRVRLESEPRLAYGQLRLPTADSLALEVLP